VLLHDGCTDAKVILGGRRSFNAVEEAGKTSFQLQKQQLHNCTIHLDAKEAVKIQYAVSGQQYTSVRVLLPKAATLFPVMQTAITTETPFEVTAQLVPEKTAKLLKCDSLRNASKQLKRFPS
jgi:hypothetical protein